METKFIENSDSLNKLCDIKFFTVQYNANTDDEVKSMPKDQIGEACNDSNSTTCGINISPIVPKRNGYRFVEWLDENNNSPGDKISSNHEGTITLYAKWEKSSYRIKYDSNGGTGNAISTICTIDKACTLAKNRFTKTGYTFIGWGLSSNSGRKYKDEEKVVNITMME